jgi:hypothetical protein
MDIKVRRNRKCLRRDKSPGQGVRTDSDGKASKSDESRKQFFGPECLRTFYIDFGKIRSFLKAGIFGYRSKISEPRSETVLLIFSINFLLRTERSSRTYKILLFDYLYFMTRTSYTFSGNFDNAHVMMKSLMTRSFRIEHIR